MKNLILLVVLALIPSLSIAQDITVKSFKLLETDMDASLQGTREIDQNGETAALIKIVTPERGFSFSCGAIGIVKTKETPGEIWLYIPRGAQKITIKHPQLGVLRDWYFTTTIQGGRSYEMKITTKRVESVNSSNMDSKSNDNRDILDAQLQKLIAGNKKENDYRILEIIKTIESKDTLNEFELFCKVTTEMYTSLYDEAIKDSKDWINKYSNGTDSLDWKMRVFWVSAESNLLSKNGDKEYGMQCFRICRRYFMKEPINIRFCAFIPLAYIEYCDYKKCGFADAIYASRASAYYLMKKDNVKIEDINNNKYPKSSLMAPFYYLALSYRYQYLWNKEIWNDRQEEIARHCLVLAAKLGAPECITFCRENKINYKKKLTKKELELIDLDNWNLELLLSK